MPAYARETTERHMERVRQVLAVKPGVSIRELDRVLREHKTEPLTFERKYLSKIIGRIRGERVHRYDEARVTARLAGMRDRIEEALAPLWSILLGFSKDGDKVAAARAIIEAEVKFLGAEMDAGVFERKLGTIAMEHNFVATPEQRQAITRAFRAAGMITPIPHGDVPAIVAAAERPVDL